MPRSVVCGIDGSKESLAAAAVAARLAQALDSRLVLGQVVEVPPTVHFGNELEAQRRWHRAGGEVPSPVDLIDDRPSGVEVAGRVLHGGDPGPALAQLASDEDAALLVVGSRGRAGLKAALLGSVSSAVVRASDRPVVIVPADAADAADAKAHERSTVVCGIDGSEEAVQAARAAARLGAALGLELVIVHAYEHPSSSAALPAAGVAPPIDYATLAEEQRAGAERLLDAVAHELADEAPARTRVAIGDPPAALDRSAQEERAELIVVGTHGRAPLAAALLGSTSARLAACASRPVVLVPRGASLRLEASAAPAGTPG